VQLPCCLKDIRNVGGISWVKDLMCVPMINRVNDNTAIIATTMPNVVPSLGFFYLRFYFTVNR